MFGDVTTDGLFNLNWFCGVPRFVGSGATCSCDSATSFYSKRGRKPNRRPALIRQSIEPVQPSAPRTVEYDEVEESQEPVAPEPTKREIRPNAAENEEHHKIHQD